MPWGHPAGDSQILNSAGELGLSRAPARAPGCQVPSVPQRAQHRSCPCCRKCVWGSNASKQSRVPALIRSSLESGVLSTGEALPSSRQRGRDPGPAAAPAVQAVAGDRRAAREAGGALSPCGSLIPPLIWLFPTVSLYLSLIIRPVLRNPALAPRQLLHIYPPRLETRAGIAPGRAGQG